MTTIPGNLQHVRARIATACQRAGRGVEEVTLLAVSKTFGADAVRAAAAAGQRAFGENYIQEGVEKIAALRDLGLMWHCIGPIQSNKTRLVAEHFDWVHTVDRLKIAERLSAQRPADRPPLNVCIQVNIDGGANKSGVAPGEALALARAEIGKAVFGQERVIELTLAAVLAGGHVLLVGAPGLAKTRLVEATARVLGLDWGRVQFTPDLMPADILGSEVLDQDEAGRRHFRFVKGPIFTQLLMADEINRASPRTQSALLQAMQEYHVTVAGVAHDVPRPFHVLATQNPIEHEGAYPLPEAQLDRFLLQVDVPYPDAEIERRILIETTGLGDVRPQPVLNPDSLVRLQRLVRSMPVGEKVLAAILELVRSARPGSSHDPRVNQHVAWGPGPRAGQALMLAVRARALLRGRLAPAIDDVAALARPALVHRMQLSFGARAEGLDIDTLVDELAQRAA